MRQQQKMIDHVSGWLRIYEDGSVDRTWTGPPEGKFMSDHAPPHSHFIDGVAVKDVIAGEGSGLKVRIYLPEIKESKPERDNLPLPVLLHFHGGGFCISEADWFMYYAAYTRLARTAKAVVVSVFLRRAPENRLPAPCDDGLAAFLWLRAIAAGQSGESWLQERANFNRVFLIGDSAGGNIVHYVAARAGQEDLTPLKLAGAIPIHPGFCRSIRSQSELEQPESPFLTVDMVDKFLSLALPAGATKDHPITCPMGPAAIPPVKLNLPPYLYCVADQDLLKDPQLEFYESLQIANKSVELLMNRGVGHSFYLNQIAMDLDPKTAQETEKLFQGIKQFIDKY